MHFLSFFQKKRKICEAVRKVLSGVTEALGTFIQDLATVEDGDLAESSVRRSKRRRIAKHYEEVQEEETEEDPDYEAEEQEFLGSSNEGSLGLDSEDDMDHAGNPNDIGGMEEDEDLVPLSTRLNKFKSVAKEPVSSYGTVRSAKHWR